MPCTTGQKVAWGVGGACIALVGIVVTIIVVSFAWQPGQSWEAAAWPNANSTAEIAVAHLTFEERLCLGCGSSSKRDFAYAIYLRPPGPLSPPPVPGQDLKAFCSGIGQVDPEGLWFQRTASQVVYRSINPDASDDDLLRLVGRVYRCTASSDEPQEVPTPDVDMTACTTDDALVACPFVTAPPSPDAKYIASTAAFRDSTTGNFTATVHILDHDDLTPLCNASYSDATAVRAESTWVGSDEYVVTLISIGGSTRNLRITPSTCASTLTIDDEPNCFQPPTASYHTLNGQTIQFDFQADDSDDYIKLATLSPPHPEFGCQ